MINDHIERAVGRLEGKVDEIHDLLKSEIDERKSLAKRVAAIEQGRAHERGWAAGIAAAVSTAITAITLYFKTQGH